MRRTKKSRLATSRALLALGGLAAFGCTTPSSTDAAVDVVAVDNVVAPGPDAAFDAPTTLYQRLGGHAGIAGTVNAIVAQELTDPEIASYFYFQVTAGSSGTPPVDGHPSVAQLESCFVNLLGSVAGGPEVYPGIPADNMGFQCRDMRSAHAGLDIPGSTFDRFVTIAAGVLTSAGVAPADITSVGTALNGTRGEVALGTTRDGGSFTPPDASATDAATDASSTLYSRLGGRAGITSAIDAIVAQELTDPEIASYFYFQVTAGSGGAPPVDGHPSVAQVKACFVNLLGNAAGGPEAYPGTPADSLGFQCRDMMSAHAGLNIPGSVFDRFVTIAAGVLTSAGVLAADVTAVGTVLNGTRTQVAQGTTRDGGSFMPPDASH